MIDSEHKSIQNTIYNANTSNQTIMRKFLIEFHICCNHHATLPITTISCRRKLLPEQEGNVMKRCKVQAYQVL